MCREKKRNKLKPLGARLVFVFSPTYFWAHNSPIKAAVFEAQNWQIGSGVGRLFLQT